ncbi:Hypothetical predicted protein, partial [Paramuricea clavata]
HSTNFLQEMSLRVLKYYSRMSDNDLDAMRISENLPFSIPCQHEYSMTSLPFRVLKRSPRFHLRQMALNWVKNVRDGSKPFLKSAKNNLAIQEPLSRATKIECKRKKFVQRFYLETFQDPICWASTRVRGSKCDNFSISRLTSYMTQSKSFQIPQFVYNKYCYLCRHHVRLIKRRHSVKFVDLGRCTFGAAEVGLCKRKDRGHYVYVSNFHNAYGNFRLAYGVVALTLFKGLLTSLLSPVQVVVTETSADYSPSLPWTTTSSRQVKSIYRSNQRQECCCFYTMVTAPRPVIIQSTWLEVKAKCLHDIVSSTIKHKISDKLVINVDQTPSKYVPTENVAMAEKNSKHIPRKGSNDKRAITATLAKTLSFFLSYNTKHWMRLLNDIIAPYIIKVKEGLGLPENQSTLLHVMDAFKAQSSEKVIRELENLAIKHMTHILQPLYLTTNASVKKMEKRGFSDYFPSTITEAMLPMHGKLMITVYDFLRQEQGKQIILNGWRTSGITEAIKEARSTGVAPSLDPFA